jgi:carbonic anhydrase
MSAHQEFATKNKSYLESFDKGDLEIPPSKGYIVGKYFTFIA